MSLVLNSKDQDDLYGFYFHCMLELLRSRRHATKAGFFSSQVIENIPMYSGLVGQHSVTRYTAVTVATLYIYRMEEPLWFMTCSYDHIGRSLHTVRCAIEASCVRASFNCGRGPASYFLSRTGDLYLNNGHGNFDRFWGSEEIQSNRSTSTGTYFGGLLIPALTQ